MVRVWLDMPSDSPDARLALKLARRHPAFVLVGVSAVQDAVDSIAEAMLEQAERFDLVTTGALTKVARLVLEHPEVRSRWWRVVCAAGQLEVPAEANVLADREAAEVALKHLAPRLVGVEASRGVPGAERKAFAPLALLSLLRPEAFNLQWVRVLVEKDGRLRLTDDGYRVEFALSAEWEVVRADVEAIAWAG